MSRWSEKGMAPASVQVALISAAFLNSDARCFGTFLSHCSLRLEALNQLSGAEKKLVSESAPSRGFLELGEAGSGCCATSATPEPVVRHATPGGGESVVVTGDGGWQQPVGGDGREVAEETVEAGGGKAGGGRDWTLGRKDF
uniref:Putative secreted protein n=1 Tax=Ixodes ricinus TaxID=34613 RepID=A0A6B0UUY9_IXORI